MEKNDFIEKIDRRITKWYTEIYSLKINIKNLQQDNIDEVTDMVVSIRENIQRLIVVIGRSIIIRDKIESSLTIKRRIMKEKVDYLLINDAEVQGGKSKGERESIAESKLKKFNQEIDDISALFIRIKSFISVAMLVHENLRHGRRDMDFIYNAELFRRNIGINDNKFKKDTKVSFN